MTKQQITPANDLLSVFFTICFAEAGAKAGFLFKKTEVIEILISHTQEAHHSYPTPTHSFILEKIKTLSGHSQEILAFSYPSEVDSSESPATHDSLLLQITRDPGEHYLLLCGLNQPLVDDQLDQLRAYRDEMLQITDALKTYFDNLQWTGGEFLPRKEHRSIRTDNYDLSIYVSEAEAVGGDFFTILSRNDHQLDFLLGDVSGKGRQAAFLMAKAKSYFRNIYDQEQTIDYWIEEANRFIHENADDHQYITLLFGQFDADKQIIRFARAGMNALLHYQRAKQTVRQVWTEGLGLGIVDKNRFDNLLTVETLPFQKGDVLLFYTDGIVEVGKQTQWQELFGQQRLEQVFEAKGHLSSSTISHEIRQEIANFSGASILKDDQTLIVLKIID